MEKRDGTHRIDAAEKDYLYTSASQIPGAGTGLHTAIPIYRDEIIATFAGELLTEEQAESRIKNNNDRYFISMPDGGIMDSMRTECFAKFANDARKDSSPLLKNNSKIALDELGNVCIIATRTIRSGEEIFCGYGKKYWEKHGG